MDAEETVRSYYETLRRGESLPPYFAETEAIVKFGISERLTGFEEVAAGLKEQTRTTNNWQIDSKALHVVEREAYAWFSDDVFMAWTDTDRQIRYEFDSRWSGTLERHNDAWHFVEMHVSTPRDL
ncbi:nuclear transport factor 2 family protein [Halocatena marina]|uniref:Nuclear transport factor 2 family protein n=1 Tax=Halocatena marina TaxID=2934937 RepID=A0ABD5YSG0_9EURY|nr:nuclear transport factor 2 family protein [Halocatena marina]